MSKGDMPWCGTERAGHRLHPPKIEPILDGWDPSDAEIAELTALGAQATDGGATVVSLGRVDARGGGVRLPWAGSKGVTARTMSTALAALRALPGVQKK